MAFQKLIELPDYISIFATVAGIRFMYSQLTGICKVCLFHKVTVVLVGIFHPVITKSVLLQWTLSWSQNWVFYSANAGYLCACPETGWGSCRNWFTCGRWPVVDVYMCFRSACVSTFTWLIRSQRPDGSNRADLFFKPPVSVSRAALVGYIKVWLALNTLKQV